MVSRLKGRTVLVTGGSRGIGAAVALACAREHAHVVIVSRKAEGLEATAASIDLECPGRVLAVPHHVGRVEEADALVSRLADEVGTVDVLVNNAGTNPYFGPLLGAEWGAWEKTFEVNLKGPFALCRAVARRLIAEGRPGSIINVASILGQTASPLQGIYGMTKAALMSMSRTLAVELGPSSIRVNCIAPGVVDTRLAAAITQSPELRAQVLGRTALGRIAQPAEIAGLVVYLASDEASYVTGQTMFIDGGYTIA